MQGENRHHGKRESRKSALGPGVSALGVPVRLHMLKAPIMKRLLLLFLLLPILTYAQDKLEEQWNSLRLQGITVGFLHRTSWQTSEGLIRSEIEQTMEIRRFGIPFTMTQTDVWIEKTDGELVSVSSELDMNGQGQLVEAEVAGADLRVRIRRGDDRDEVFLPLEDTARGFYGVERETAAAVSRCGKEVELDYRLFSPETMKIEEFNLRVLGPGKLIDSLGRAHRGVLVEEQSSSLPGVVTTEVYDPQEGFLYSKTPVGLELEILRLEGDPRKRQAEAPASEQRPGASPGRDTPEDFAAVFDVASLTVPVEGLEDLPLASIEALDVMFRGQGVPVLYESARSAEADLSSPAGAGEHPLRILSAERDGRGEVIELVLRLANSRGKDGLMNFGFVKPSGRDSEEIPPELERYLKGGFHLDLEDPRLAELLSRCSAAGDRGYPECLERLVDRYIRNKSLAYGFAGLEEVLSNREGDCTEHALLLAALLRKSGIPSRLAYGLILTEAGFIGHAWVEQYSGGSWRWLDPSFPGGRPYGLKIRLGVMDPAEPIWASLSLALIQVVGSVEGEILEATPR
jgi:hypothetical protein